MVNDVLNRNNVNVVGNGVQVMLFAHGFGCDQNAWKFVTEAFTDVYKGELFDNTGSGKSDISLYNSDKYSKLDGYAQDVIESCQALNLDNVVFVGHSVSSMIGLLAAFEKPEYFSKLVLLVPHPVI
ncbi:sigma-B regulation protein RsbQ [Mucilaginibacter gossypiicola]|uniref:Sigma-B regulation protein RsbQ n=1 Tax=Mucilaginibacter gossypiicola TaxID=551995 RepID=A0A1H8KTI2_9SPHI|nr:alpha/beta hydrolase [Mucilaginibacter gossypiicola]SEN95708.1 sigma-B regulation protein RsbQ [Mucilaginibacter gossypiicola]